MLSNTYLYIFVTIYNHIIIDHEKLELGNFVSYYTKKEMETI